MSDDAAMAAYWRKQYQDACESRNGFQLGLNRKDQEIQRLEAQVRGLTAENKRLRAIVAGAQSAGFEVSDA